MTTTASATNRRLSIQRRILLVLTVMLAGRAMTLAFVGDAGSGQAGDPPDAWLMPLLAMPLLE